MSTTTLNIQGFCNTSLKSCQETAVTCQVCHCICCTCPSTLLIPAMASFMACSNWCLYFLQLHSEKPSMFKSDNLAMPPAHLFLSIFFHNACLRILLHPWGNVEVFHYVVATFIELQEANSLNTAVLLFQKLPVIQGCWTSFNKCDPIRLLPNSPQHTLTENWCWILYCAASCGFSCTK
jgi:hypothetical protein